jgi:hypothetical protein
MTAASRSTLMCEGMRRGVGPVLGRQHGLTSGRIHQPGGLMPMNRADLIALASPPCHDCGEPVQRVEMPWHLDDDDSWRPGPYFMVCADGHRVPVEPLD